MTDKAMAAPVRGPTPPGPGGLGLRRLVHRLRDGAGFYERLQERYGDAVSFRILHRRFCVLYDPDLIGEVLVAKRASFHKGPAFKKTLILDNPTTLTADDGDHPRLRKLVQSSFRRAHLDGYAREMIVEIDRMQDGWRDGDAFDLVPVSQQLALNIAAATFFGRDIALPAAVVADTMKALKWSMTLTLLPMGGLLARLPLPANAFRRAACRRMDDLIREAIDKARRDEGRNDLISSLVRAADEDGDDRPLSDGEIRDETYVMILAGHETSANALAWCFFYLSRNPEARARLEREADETLGDRRAAPEDYEKLVYAQAVLKEALRIAPPTYVVGRTAIEDCELGGWFIPKGTTVQPCWRAPQRDGRYFRDPLAFRPERWLEDPPPDRPKHAYLPFGGGARNCLGAAFARMETAFALAQICRRWRIDPLSDRFPEVSSLGFYRFRDGLPVTVRERRD